MAPSKKLSPNAALVHAPKTVSEGFQLMARVLSDKLTPATLAPALAHIKVWQEDTKALYEAARLQALSVLRENGTPEEDSTRIKLQAGEYELSMRKSKSGYDAKKLEQLLRLKGKSPEHYMDPVISYKVSQSLIHRALANEVFTEDELEACRYDESWTLEPVKKVNDD